MSRCSTSGPTGGSPAPRLSGGAWGFASVARAAEKAFAQAGRRPEEIDLLEVHDAFTIGEILTLEALGVASRGKGDAANVADWVPALERSSLDGDLRRAVFAGGGGEAFERITERDDAARTYVYEYESGRSPSSSTAPASR